MWCRYLSVCKCEVQAASRGLVGCQPKRHHLQESYKRNKFKQEETKSTQYHQKGSKRKNLRLKIFFTTISQTCEVEFLNQSQVLRKAKIRLARAQPIASNKRITSRSPASWGIKKCVSIQYHLDMYKWQKKTDKGMHMCVYLCIHIYSVHICHFTACFRKDSDSFSLG